MLNPNTTNADPSTPSGAPDARSVVDQLISRALHSRASDVHFDPELEGVRVRFRVDGLLEDAAGFDCNMGRMVVSRLMVMAQLLTYRMDVPQEGRAMCVGRDGKLTELRIAIMPTVHGPRAAVRLPAEALVPHALNELSLPRTAMDGLEAFICGDSGMLVVTGPAGSGKTTTLYAVISEIARRSPGISIVTLEDPVERNLPGVVQIEVKPFGELTYERALRSILRQDPQVLMLGEIRDAPTASLAVQAALTGHRLLCTFHAASPAGAIVRLLDMGIEPYQLTSSIFGILSQRLVRKLNQESASRQYRGRVPIAEWARLDDRTRSAIRSGGDEPNLRSAIELQEGFQSLREIANDLTANGVSDSAEIDRVLCG